MNEGLAGEQARSVVTLGRHFGAAGNALLELLLFLPVIGLFLFAGVELGLRSVIAAELENTVQSSFRSRRMQIIRRVQGPESVQASQLRSPNRLAVDFGRDLYQRLIDQTSSLFLSPEQITVHAAVIEVGVDEHTGELDVAFPRLHDYFQAGRAAAHNLSQGEVLAVVADELQREDPADLRRFAEPRASHWQHRSKALGVDGIRFKPAAFLLYTELRILGPGLAGPLAASLGNTSTRIERRFVLPLRTLE